MKRYLMALIATLFAMSMCVTVSAQEPAAPKPPATGTDVKAPAAKQPASKEPAKTELPAKEAPAKSPAAKDQARSKDYRAVKALRAGGFSVCADSVDETLKFFHKKDDFAYLNIRDERRPADKHSAAIFTIKTYNDGNSYATLNISPREDGACDIGFSQIFFFYEKCPLVRELGFRDWKLNLEYDEVSVYEDPTSKTVVISLTPTANGCLAVKTGTFHFPSKNK